MIVLHEVDSPVNLEKIFEKFFESKIERKNLLSFRYNIDTKQTLLKKRLSRMSEINPCDSVKIKPKKLKNIDGQVIPESFLSLMDDLCIDRKDARKFFENPNEWTFIKSDRKIFCPQTGTVEL